MNCSKQWTEWYKTYIYFRVNSIESKKNVRLSFEKIFETIGSLFFETLGAICSEFS